jgi:putative ABC transport system permease protein
VIGMGHAAEVELVRQFETSGPDLVIVRAERYQRLAGRWTQVGRFSSLARSDVRILAQSLPSAYRLSGIVEGQSTVRRGGRSTSVQIVGVEPSYFEIQRMDLAGGRYFTEEESRGLARVVVLSSRLSEALFSPSTGLGEVLGVNGIPLRVVGVLSEKATELGATSSAYIPIQTAGARVFGRDSLDAIVISWQTVTLLRHSHHIQAGRPNDFTVVQPAALRMAETDTRAAFRGFLAAISLVALASGAAGILVVMLIGVRQRAREIGLRRAIGASRQDILVQFLLEGGLLGGLGASGGAVVGLAANAVACVAFGWGVVWPLGTAVVGVGLGVVLGMLCGAVPALQAARLDAAVALRTAR